MLFSLTSDSSMQIFKWDGKTNHYKFPTFAVLDANVVANLYYFDQGWFEKQIDIADVNPDTIGELNMVALMLISAYDLSANKEFLNLAKRIYARLNTDEIYYLINTLQIKIRETGLSDSDKKKLSEVETEDAQALFCISVLLGNKNDADAYYKRMSKEEKDLIKDLPIIKLYSGM